MEKLQVAVPIYHAEIFCKINKHKKWLHGAKDGKRADFSNRVFRTFYVFKNIDLTGAIFSSVKAYNLHFSECNLTRCDFRGSSILDTRFSRVNFDFADLRNCSFAECDMTISGFCNTKIDASISSVDTLHFEPDVEYFHITKKLPWLLTNACFRRNFFGAESQQMQ